jgi:hypothetical protein
MRNERFWHSLGIIVMFVTLKQGRDGVGCSTRLCSVGVAHERPVNGCGGRRGEEKVRRRKNEIILWTTGTGLARIMIRYSHSSGGWSSSLHCTVSCATNHHLHLILHSDHTIKPPQSISFTNASSVKSVLKISAQSLVPSIPPPSPAAYRLIESQPTDVPSSAFRTRKSQHQDSSAVEPRLLKALFRPVPHT